MNNIMSLSWETIESILMYLGLIFVILMTIGGNLIVLFAFFNDPHLLNPSNNFLLSMAIADLLVGLIGMPFYSYAEYKTYWPFGQLFCKIWITIDDVVTMASVLSIVAITIERYWSINHSAHYRRYTTKTRVRLFSLLIWLIPFLNFAPGIWFLDSGSSSINSNQSNQTKFECIGAYHSHTLYLIIAQINFFAWPLAVIIILNGLIVVNLYKRSHRFPVYASFRVSPPTLRHPRKSQSKEPRRVTLEENQQCLKPYVQINLNANGNNLNLGRRTSNRNGYALTILPSIEDVNENATIVDTDETHLSPLKNIPDRSNKSTSNNNRRVRYVLLPPSATSSGLLTIPERRSSKSTQTSTISSVDIDHHRRNSLFQWRRQSMMLAPPELQLQTVKTVRTKNGEQRAVRRLRRDKRAATSLFTLVLVFMIFLLPYVVVVVFGRAFSIEVFTDTNSQVYSAAFWLLWLNSTVNPIIYPFIQPRFREAYRRIFLRFTQNRRSAIVSMILDFQRNK